MPPRRLVNSQQLEIMLDYLEKNKNIMLRGLSGCGMQTAYMENEVRNKWCQLAKMANAVENGHKHTPVGWRKYWTAYRHKIKKKAENCREIETGQSNGNYVPLTDVELRILSIVPEKTPKINNQLSSSTGTSPSEQEHSSVYIQPKIIEEDDKKSVVYMIKAGPKIERQKTSETTSGISSESFSKNNKEDVRDRSISPPPQWALNMEERRIAAQERTANALETIAALMTSQEERRAVLNERISDAVTTIATTVQELNTKIQDTLQHLNSVHQDGSDPDIKDHSYL